MVNEEKEHVGNLPVNVFPISAEGGRGRRGGEGDCFTCIDKLRLPTKRTELIVGLI